MCSESSHLVSVVPLLIRRGRHLSYFFLKHWLKYERLLKPTAYATSVTVPRFSSSNLAPWRRRIDRISTVGVTPYSCFTFSVRCKRLRATSSARSDTEKFGAERWARTAPRTRSSNEAEEASEDAVSEGGALYFAPEPLAELPSRISVRAPVAGRIVRVHRESAGVVQAGTPSRLVGGAGCGFRSRRV